MTSELDNSSVSAHWLKSFDFLTFYAFYSQDLLDQKTCPAETFALSMTARFFNSFKWALKKNKK